MNNRVFIILLLVLAAALGGWIYYTTTQAVSAEPIEEISTKWWASAHADITSESFVHWNEDDPAEVPPTCAKCHSGRGFIDYIGQDGSAEFVVDQPGAIESVVSCSVCHSDAAHALDVAIFPSGVEINGKGMNSLCMTCHSGMAAGNRVDTIVSGVDPDTVMPDSSLIGPHYKIAAATNLGGDAQGGYEYEGKTYVGAYAHAEGVQTCTECHDPHSLRMNQPYDAKNANLCSACHSNVTSFQDYKDIYYEDGTDYDGDGTIEGLYHEIQGVREVLKAAITTYSTEVIGTTLGIGDNFPYAFIDTNSDGELSEEESAFPNAFKLFTPRLQKAAFNYMFVKYDGGNYVHNGKYVLQLMYDSIADLAEVSSASTAGLTRP